MLVLERKEGEVILIGNDIEVRVVSVRGDKIRIGVTAPKSVPVYREEIIVAERLRAARAAGGEGAE